MIKQNNKKILTWIIVSINLVIGFFTGLLIVPKMEFTLGFLIGSGILLGLIIFDYLILDVLKREFNFSDSSKKIIIWLFLSANLFFAFFIGLTIFYMESIVRYNMGLFMIPLLLILNYIIVDRYQFYSKASRINNDVIEKISEDKIDPKKYEDAKKKKYIIEFEGKTYIFTIRSILILFIGAPILSYGIYLFFDLPMNYWLHEIVVKQTIFFLNLLFDMGVEAHYLPRGTHHWSFFIPDRGNIYFQTFCTGVQAICIFAGIIICIPHSQDPKTNEDILWRKTKALIISSALFYIVNIIRMIIQLYLFYIGYAWEDIHYSISAASSFIAAIIILLLHKWIPEFIISIIYTLNMMGKKIKESKQIKKEETKE